MTKKKMTLKRFQKLVEAYGASPLAWPVGERASGEAFLADNAKAKDIAHLAGQLDVALDIMPAPKKADSAFIKRLGTIPFAAKAAAVGREATPETFQEFLKGLFPAKSIVPQGAGLAAALVLGVWLGFFSGDNVDTTVIQLDASQYLLENPDLEDDLEKFN